MKRILLSTVATATLLAISSAPEPADLPPRPYGA